MIHMILSIKECLLPVDFYITTSSYKLTEKYGTHHPYSLIKMIITPCQINLSHSITVQTESQNDNFKMSIKDLHHKLKNVYCQWTFILLLVVINSLKNMVHTINENIKQSVSGWDTTRTGVITMIHWLCIITELWHIGGRWFRCTDFTHDSRVHARRIFHAFLMNYGGASFDGACRLGSATMQRNHELSVFLWSKFRKIGAGKEPEPNPVLCSPPQSPYGLHWTPLDSIWTLPKKWPSLDWSPVQSSPLFFL